MAGKEILFNLWIMLFIYHPSVYISTVVLFFVYNQSQTKQFFCCNILL